MSTKVEETKPKKRHRLRRFFVITLLLLVLLILFAPTIVANTFLRNRLASMALCDLHGQVQIGSASLGWFSAPVLKHVTITDTAGKKVISIAKIEGTKSLLSLLWDSSDLGTFRCHKPKVEVVCKSKSTNLEEVFAEFLKPSSTSGGESIALKLELTEGVIHIQEASTSRDWTLSELTCSVQTSKKSEEPISVELSAKVKEAGRSSVGSVAATLAIGSENGTVKVKAQGVPLSLAQAIGQRFDPTLRVSGDLHCQLTGNWEKSKLVFSGQVEQIQITPEMCNSAMKYAVPALAGVTQGKGQISLVLQDCRVPLADFSKSTIRGTLKIHSTEINGNPMIQELSTLLLQKPARVGLKTNSQITFAMEDGWVRHQGMEIVFPELTIRTYGAVRLDGQLSMMAEFPIPPKWLARVGSQSVKRFLANRRISVPIRGTLSSPKLDRRTLEKEFERFLKDAVDSLLEKTIHSQLRKLFDRD